MLLVLKMPINQPSSCDGLLHDDTLPTSSVSLQIDSVKVISMMWAAMGQDVKKVCVIPS